MNTSLFQCFEFFNQGFAFPGQAGAGFPVCMDHGLSKMGLRGLDLGPDRFIGHVHLPGGLVDGTGPVDGFQKVHFARPEGYLIFRHDPDARSGGACG